MKRFISTLTLSLLVLLALAKSVTPAASLPEYYAEVDGKSGKTLFDAVHVVAKVGYSSLGYKGLWTAYKTTDLRANGKIWDMYSDCSWTYSSDQCGSYSNECDCYNREHSIPKSWFGGSESQPGCDIFHIVPTDGKVNGMRSNYAFGEVSSASYSFDGAKLGSAKSITIVNGSTIAGNEGTIISASGIVFEPRDEYKGDFARGYFGTMIKWAGDYQSFTSGDGSKIFSSNYSVGAFGLTKYGVALLMKWHRQDPVSQKEIDRNNGIQQTQGNRNPFIDYPYLAEYIWGEKAGESLDLSKLITAYDSRFVLGESDGYLSNSGSGDQTGGDNTGGDNSGDDNTGEDNNGDDNTGEEPVEQYTIAWMVNGEEYSAGDPTVLVNGVGVVRQLPTAPKSCSEESEQFVGWSEQTIIGWSNDMPDDLFSTADDAPEIVQNTIFNAVFAHVEEITTSTSAASVMMNLNSQTDWTLSGLIKDTKHWRMVTNSYIESPSINASQITSITINMRTYGGTSYNTIEFTQNGTKIGELVAANKTLKDYTWEPKTTLHGVGALRFTGRSSTAENGPALSSITIQLKGGESIVYEYSHYVTSCGSTTTTLPQAPIVENQGTKILHNGRLLIEYNGLYYNILGQIVEK